MTLAREPLDARIRRFPRSYRRRLRKLAKRSTHIRDLLYTFPGAAFVLAGGQRPHGTREQALKLVTAGQPLNKVAAALNVPFWLRRLPPEAFGATNVDVLEDPDLGRKIIHLIPESAEATPMWLKWVAFGAETCDAAFAIWLARQPVFRTNADCGAPLLPLSAFAWFSRRKAEIGYQLTGAPWHEKMSFQNAVLETRDWLERIVLNFCLGEERQDHRWHQIQKFGQYHFVPLATRDALQEEGRRMRHCVATYWSNVAIGGCLIYSVRLRDRHVATMEIVCADFRARSSRIAQLRGPGNAEPSDDIISAACGWLSKQGKFPMRAEAALGKLAMHCHRWERVWQPFCQAKPRLGTQLLPAKLSTSTRLFTDLQALERYLG